MIQNHIILAIAWIVFCVFHSLLAAGVVKQKIADYSPVLFKWYRPIYILIALLTFGAVLFYQFSIPTLLIYKINTATIILGSIIGIVGLFIMLICIVKYFSIISGLHSLRQHTQNNNTLLTTGLHRYVRHPLYFGTFLFIWGIFISLPYLSWLISSMIITVYTLIGIRYEEAKLEIQFGAAYKVYKQKVPKILPKYTEFTE